MSAFWIGSWRRATCCRGAAVALAVTAVALGIPGSGLAAGAWTGPTVIDNSNPPENVSCPTTTFCAAVGAGGYGQTFNGSAWGPPTNIDPSTNPSGHTLTGVSCPSAGFCMAVDMAGNAIPFNGSTWGAPVGVDTTRNSFTAVSCTSASFCVAGDGGGNGFAYNGSTWSAPVTINNVSNHEGVYGLACPVTSFCIAVGERGDVETSTNGGVSWSAPVDIAADNLNSVSCPSASFCVAIDAGGNAYTYNGASWSAADPIDTANGGEFRAVSCPSSTFCVAIDSHETVLTFDGSSWSAPQQLEPAALASGVSCASSSFCVAVDGGGNAFVYGVAAPTPQPLPAPIIGKTVNATPVSGVVFVKPPRGKAVDRSVAAGRGFVRLTAATQIPIGSEINSLHGSLMLVTAAAKEGRTQSGTFNGAIFTLTQAASGASKGLATLSLVEGAFRGAPTYGVCASTDKAADGSTAAAGSRTLQLLHASAHGKFRTRGRYSAATVLGTTWTVADRCDGTLTHDITDRVSVTDFVRHKTIVLHAGQSYLAKAPPARK
ncbi:MAG TPA: hypothetical protein VMA96_05190 [Solirubrobacteraceae bacterium]|nr:hypothetical protein [Solirubrobacteraceae bacterium]